MCLINYETHVKHECFMATFTTKTLFINLIIDHLNIDFIY